MKVTTNANVLQNSKSKVRHSWQNVLLFGEWIWSGYVQGADQKPKLTPSCCSFCR